MTSLNISFKNLLASPLTSLLNIILVAFGSAILVILLLATTQIIDKLEKNSKDIDLVVGAKGSPLQLVLSSIYYIDFPTGNIPLKDAEAIAVNPMVRRAVPLALGDSYNGFRIVGTDTSFIHLYELKLSSGRYWKTDFEVSIGSAVAEVANLKVGDRFFGAHGLSGEGEIHRSHAYIVAGILAPQGNMTDNLVMTNVASVWKMHDHDHHGEQPGEALHGDHHESESDQHEHHADKEITSLLIQYRSPMSVVTFPRMVNQSTNMQAASPAMESARLFSLIGVGVDTLQWFAVLIMFIAALSVFISLLNSLKERKYDLAIMRSLGASRGMIFRIIIFEGMIMAGVGAITGLAAGHMALEVAGSFQETPDAKLSGLYFTSGEGFIVLAAVLTGIVASVVPALQAYRTDISKVLAKR